MRLYVYSTLASTSRMYFTFRIVCARSIYFKISLAITPADTIPEGQGLKKFFITTTVCEKLLCQKHDEEAWIIKGQYTGWRC